MTPLRGSILHAETQRDSHLVFRMELETLAGHAKGKGSKRWTREAESTDGPVRRGPPHSSDEAG